MNHSMGMHKLPELLQSFPHKRVLAALIGFNFVFAVGAYSGVLSESMSLWWTDGAWTIASLVASLKSFHTASLAKSVHEKVAWRLFGLAALSWFIGIIFWDYFELFLKVTTPYPSVADYFFMLFAPIFIAGTLYYRSEFRARYVTLIQVGNIGVICCTVLIIILMVFYGQIPKSQESGLYIVFAIGYAVVYMAAFVFALYCYWFFVWGRNKHVFLALLIALAVHAGSDLLYATALLGKTYSVADFINLFWIVAFSFQIYAAVQQDALLASPDHRVSNTAQTDSHLFEGVVPAVAIFSIILSYIVFADNVNESSLQITAYIGLVFGLFLTLREWSLSRALHEATENLKAQVNERTRELSEANTQLESYSYSIAHDLRAPLRSVTSFSQILLSDAQDKLDADEKDSLQRIINSGKYMANLIDDILEYSRMARSKLDRQEIDVSALAHNVVERIQSQDMGLHARISIESDIKTNADPNLLEILLENLLRNAFKFTQHNPDALIEFGREKIKGKSYLYIKDNGAGFDMRYVEKLFKPFHRLHSADEYEGTGIGLAIVKRIVEQHDGEVRATAEVDKGACFYFTLTGH